MSIREIAEICDTRLKLWSSHHLIKTVLASGPPPSIQMRHFPQFDDTPDPAQRRHNIVQLHAEGWSVASIAEYVAVSKQTVYTTLKRWVQEGVKGLDDKSHARKAPRVVTLEIANEIRKKQENPLIGEWRMLLPAAEPVGWSAGRPVLPGRDVPGRHTMRQVHGSPNRQRTDCPSPCYEQKPLLPLEEQRPHRRRASTPHSGTR